MPRGVRRKPRFESAEHAQWFANTSKTELYVLLRDATIQLIGEQYADIWLIDAQQRQQVLKENGMLP